MAKKKTAQTGAHHEMLDEAAKLAKNFAAAAREFKDSPSIHKAAKDALRHLQETGREIRDAVEKTRKSPANKKLEREVGRIVKSGKTRGEKAINSYKAAVVKGLRSMNDQISGLVDRLKK